MGIFGSLFGKKKEPVEDYTPVTDTPITEESAIHKIFEKVFYEEMKNVEGISESDKSTIFHIIDGCDGGFRNMGGYHQQVYDTYFKGKSWTWTWYDKWAERFAEYGRYPTSFFVKQVMTEDFVYGLLTAPELKAILKERNIAFTSKHKKQDLVDLAKDNLKVNDVPLVAERIAEHTEKERFEIYTILMRTMSFRTNNLDKAISATKYEFMNVELMQVHDDHKVFSDMALDENPKAIPPLYPYDLTWLKPEVKF